VEEVRSVKPDSRVTISLVRKGKKLKVKVIMGKYQPKAKGPTSPTNSSALPSFTMKDNWLKQEESTRKSWPTNRITRTP